MNQHYNVLYKFPAGAEAHALMREVMPADLQLLTLETALVRALEEKWIAGAGLDVFEQEPLGTVHPLLRFPNFAQQSRSY